METKMDEFQDWVIGFNACEIYGSIGSVTLNILVYRNHATLIVQTPIKGQFAILY